MVAVMSASYGYAARLIPPEKRGKQFALYNATLFLSWGLPGTFLTGPLVDLLSADGGNMEFAYRMAFVAAAALVAIGSVILMVNVRGDRRLPPATR
jgi:MFS family permease